MSKKMNLNKLTADIYSVLRQKKTIFVKLLAIKRLIEYSFKEDGEKWGGYKDAINDPPKKSGLYLCRVGKTFSEYLTYYKACRKEYQIWGSGRESPITDMDVVLWKDIPGIGLCTRCKKEEAVMDFKERLEPVCGPCFGELEEESNNK